MKNNAQTTTGKNTRHSYVNVFEAISQNGGKPKYSDQLIISKDDTETIDGISKAIEAAYENGKNKLMGANGQIPPFSALRTPLRDGDLERPGDPIYKNCYFINARNPKPPIIVGSDKHPITEPSEFFSGCYGRACISFYIYNANGNRGIACSLLAIQKTADGEPLGGSVVNLNKVFPDESASEDSEYDDFMFE